MSDLREWALKWVEGSIISYLRGKTSLNILIGRIKRAMQSYGVAKKDILAIMESVQRSPVYLPSLAPEEKSKRIDLLKERLEGSGL